MFTLNATPTILILFSHPKPENELFYPQLFLCHTSLFQTKLFSFNLLLTSVSLGRQIGVQDSRHARINENMIDLK